MMLIEGLLALIIALLTGFWIYKIFKGMDNGKE